MRPLYDLRYAHLRRDLEALKPWPLARLWDAWLADIVGHRDLHLAEGDDDAANPAYARWRRRQVRRMRSELGDGASGLVHAVMAVELSDGCTVGCWFCGISADRFKGNYAYTPGNAALWRGVVGTANDWFGRAARTGFCYWATDPSDNPDYPRFLDDFHAITGHLPQTTTAAALKNIDQTRTILAMEREKGTVLNRFSVLSRKQLDQIHAAFTPDDLMFVELVQQQTQSLQAYADAGRAHERKAKLAAAGRDNDAAVAKMQTGTIACVSGVLVQMLQRKASLVTPTRCSPRWPKGYRVVAEAGFDDAAGFRAALDGFRDHHMRQHLYGGDRVAFRGDLTARIDGDRLVLGNECVDQSMGLDEGGGLAVIAPLLVAGRSTLDEIIRAALLAGVNPFVAQRTVQVMFENGLFDEEELAPLGATGPAPAAVAA
jgi:radical SAM family RiPP maturation amino acid epimerase